MAGTGTAHMRDPESVLLAVKDLTVSYPFGRGGQVQAVSGISFDVARGETLGLVGESGCGKTSAGRAIMQLPPPTSGVIDFDGIPLTALDPTAIREVRPRFQMIFQDPISSLNPRRKVRDLVEEGIQVWPERRNSTGLDTDALLESVGLDPSAFGDRRPHQMSGGQCQRVCIARALSVGPDLIVCDEPVSALDASVQAQILNLLRDMKERFGLTMIFIAHDLAVVKNVSDRVAVMYLGKLCELAPSDTLYSSPAHPYTKALMDSIPEPDPDTRYATAPLRGEIPSPIDPPSGCRFRTRCPKAQAVCALDEPQIREVGEKHYVACHFPLVESPSDSNRSQLPTVSTRGQDVAIGATGTLKDQGDGTDTSGRLNLHTEADSSSVT